MDRKQLLHVKSKDLVEGKPKLPTVEQIDYGELAINYAADNEKISLKNSSDSIVTISTDAQNEAKFATQTRVAEIDEVVSKSFDVMNTSCGFNSGMQYTPQNSLIKNCVSLSEAIEIIANKVSTSTINTLAINTIDEFKNTVNNVTTLENLPINGHLVIANINTNTDTLSLSSTLNKGNEIRIIIHNSSKDNLIININDNFIKLSKNDIIINPDNYGEINIISDGKINYIRYIE